jgi:hypothetical protein
LYNTFAGHGGTGLTSCVTLASLTLAQEPAVSDH